jgi:hypothetical protein
MKAGVTASGGEKVAVFLVIINCSESLDEMIEAGRFDEINEAIRLVNFPWKRKGSKQVELTLIQFDQAFEPAAIRRIMAARGYRPAFIEELLALGREEPNLQRTIPIVALGSGRIIKGRRYAACLGGSASSRTLGLTVVYRRWSIYYRFAFVRK